MKRYILSFIIFYIIILNINTVRSDDTKRENYDNQIFYLNFDTSYYYPDSVINTIYKYSIMEKVTNDSSQIVIDTFLATQPLRDYDDSLYHYIYCNEDCCYIFIRNIENSFYIDTFYYSCSDSIDDWLDIGFQAYDIDIKKNNILFTDLDSVNIVENKITKDKDIDFIMVDLNSTFFTTINRLHKLDTIQVFNNTDYAFFTNDKSQILITSKLQNHNYHSVSVYDIESDSIHVLNISDTLTRSNPQKINKNSPLYYQRFNPPYVNVYKYDFTKKIEVPVTNLTEFHVRDYYLFGDSLIYYYYVNNDLEDLRDKTIQLE